LQSLRLPMTATTRARRVSARVISSSGRRSNDRHGQKSASAEPIRAMISLETAAEATLS
jgi:hypothetical protein